MSTGERDDWWREYFDERFLELYHPLLPEESTQEEVEALVQLLALPPGARVLDLACGWGRHALELARAGYRVVGLDLSPVLLARAHASALAQDLPVAWVRADVREIPFHGAFDVVLSLFSSLGLFLSDEEDLRVLRAVRAALRPGGVFVLETMHRDHVAREFVERDWWTLAGGVHVWVEREFDAVAGVSREWLRWRRGGEVGEKFHAIRVRSATEWADLLERAGFEPLEWLGGWDLRPFSHAAERLIVRARRGDTQG